ncbi:hypothetical protein GGP80_003316 [Salinibacter ruber]|uniref:hypothetical protein n=1 Tax=Salinibacter ruber TaxID=146919 RepID=UPI002166F268|nr:hypothetical protein [Salinibacter ruber]MCS3937306.1 hypothetical protein [Salinibacter ruber]
MDQTEATDATLEDWVRGYALTYFPDTEATERLVERLVGRIPDMATDLPLTDVQREALKETFGGESASLVEIVEEVLDEAPVEAQDGAARHIAEEWMRTKAPAHLAAVVGADDELPPIYAQELRKKVRQGLREAL